VTTAAEIVASAVEADDQNAGVVALLETSRELQRLVAVWPNVPLPEDPDPTEECPEDLPAAVRLRWVWSRIDPDPIPTWIMYAGLPDAAHVRRAIRLAQDNRIVFPDGTRSNWAEVYVQRIARVALGVRQGAPRREAPAPPPPAPFPEPDLPSAEETDPLSMEGMIRPGRRLRPPGGGG
jgi:hypothetical protein